MNTELKNGSRLSGSVENIPLKDIRQSSNNLRSSENLNIDRISRSIKLHGLINPLLVRPMDEGFEIVAGYRRFLACKLLKWKKIPCHVVHIDEMESFEVAIVENIRRKSFTPLEEANAYKMYVSDRGWGSITELSKKIGKSPSSIIRRIELLNLPENILKDIRNSNLSPSNAVELLSVKNLQKQSQLAKMIARRHLTVKNVRSIIKDTNDFNDLVTVESRSRLQSIDICITSLKITMNKVISVIEQEQKENNDYLTFELLVGLKNDIHIQIDILLKFKKKYLKKYCGTARF